MSDDTRLSVPKPDITQGIADSCFGADHRLASNERLEFLGDAILGAVVCEQLFRKFPDYLEGDLTRIKSVVVSRRTCAKISAELGLEQFLTSAREWAHTHKPLRLCWPTFLRV